MVAVIWFARARFVPTSSVVAMKIGGFGTDAYLLYQSPTRPLSWMLANSTRALCSIISKRFFMKTSGFCEWMKVVNKKAIVDFLKSRFENWPTPFLGRRNVWECTARGVTEIYGWLVFLLFELQLISMIVSAAGRTLPLSAGCHAEKSAAEQQ